jgi:hypothetical protein
LGSVPSAPAGARDAGLDVLTPTSQHVGLARPDGVPPSDTALASYPRRLYDEGGHPLVAVSGASSRRTAIPLAPFPVPLLGGPCPRCACLLPPAPLQEGGHPLVAVSGASSRRAANPRPFSGASYRRAVSALRVPRAPAPLQCGRAPFGGRSLVPLLGGPRTLILLPGASSRWAAER